MTNIVASIVKKSGASSEIAFENSLRYLTFFVTTCFGLLWALYSWIGVSSPPKIEDTSTTRNISKPGLLESLKVLRNNSLLYSLAIIVLSYGLTIEFSEIMWKSVVKEVFPDKTEYLAFMGNYSSLIGLSAFFMMLIGSGVINMLGWKAGALMTPLVMGVLGAPFFWFYSKAKIDISRKSLLIAAYVGLVQNVLSKAAKYAVFDPTKEMAYMQLDANAKVQGKAAIDVLGARAGKCLGAFVQQLVIVLTGSLASGTFVVSMLYYLVIANWIGKYLSEINIKNY